MIQSTDHTGRAHYLKNVRTGQPVERGQTLETFRGERLAIIGGRAPHHSASTGRVWTETGREYFPAVFGCTWEAVA